MIKSALTFDDILLKPAYSEILPKNADLTTNLTKTVKLNIPLVSSAMDTVTESKTAIAMAQEGGIGIIHKNLSPEDQAYHVSNVKQFEAGLIVNAVTIGIDATIPEVVNIMSKRGISGIPVLDESDKLRGIITSRDLRFTAIKDNVYVKDVMTDEEDLITIDTKQATPEKARQIISKHKIEKLLVVDDNFKCVGLITAKDLEKSRTYPNASKDSKGRLLVGAAVGVRDLDKYRVELLLDADVDVIVIDTAHGHSKGVVDMLKWIKSSHPECQVIAGNVATADGTKLLIDSGADAIKVGIGPGSICTTRMVSGVGVPQITAIMDCFNVSEAYNIPIIADGGIRYSGEVAKAIAVGADAVMLGSVFAGTEEAPGEVFSHQGRRYKTYRGMGSLGAMKDGSGDRYNQDDNDAQKMIPEGIEGRIPYKGDIRNIIFQMIGGLRSSMGYTGCPTIFDLQTKTEIIKITHAGLIESHVHDVTITKESPNYQG